MNLDVASAFAQVLQPEILAAIFAGALMGYLVGAMPGLGPAVSVALLLPFTYDLDPLVSLALLTALYAAAEYGGSITAIIVNIPGEAAATPTTFDGYALTRQGKPGKALGMSMVASCYAGLLSTVALLLASVPLAEVALKFGPPEYFALALFGLTVAATLSGGSRLKAGIAVCLGLLIGTIGLDSLTGTPRYAYLPSLFEGVSLVPALIGLFAISEVLVSLERHRRGISIRSDFSRTLPTMAEYRQAQPAMLRGTIIGFLIGVIPGAGKSIASFIAYNEERRASKTPEEFGKGSLRGVAAPEAANNSVVGGALVPLLSLGIPGSATAAVLVGAFLIHGLQPGPLLFVENSDIVYGLFAALFVGNLLMLGLGLLGTSLWTKVVSIPPGILMPIILALSLLAAYADSNSMFTMWEAIIFGLLGYALRKFDFPIAPIVLALVLGDLLESSFRRSLVISEGTPAIFLERPLALVLIGLTLLSILWPLTKRLRQSRRSRVSVG
jgi:putative tricarboxylic transport membrane protein